MHPKVAAITVASHQPALLPVWVRHYARQVGTDGCYVVEHGAPAAADLPPGVNRLRLPHADHDERRRARFVSDLTTALLGYYDWVLHSEVDELVLADPRHFPTIPAYCAAALAPTMSAIGLDVQHVTATEPPLDPGRPVGGQRGWVRFTSAMCKPVLTRKPLRWTPGFHGSDQALAFGPLYLFHLHWADRELGLRRLAQTRSLPWAGGAFAALDRIDDAQWLGVAEAMAAMPRVDGIDFDPAAAPLRDWLRRVVDSSAGRDGDTAPIDLGINAAELWPIPPGFRARL